MTELVYNVEQIDDWHKSLDRAYIVRLIVIGRCHGETNLINLHLETRSLGQCGLGEDREYDMCLAWGSRYDDDCTRALTSVNRTRLVEDAAVGVAAVVFPNTVKGTFINVAKIGRSFDYYLNTEDGQYGLEVSGTEQSGKLGGLHNTKVKQLLQNDSGKDGFVVVCGFREKKVILSFHRYAERESA